MAMSLEPREVSSYNFIKECLSGGKDTENSFLKVDFKIR